MSAWKTAIYVPELLGFNSSLPQLVWDLKALLLLLYNTSLLKTLTNKLNEKLHKLQEGQWAIFIYKRSSKGLNMGVKTSRIAIMSADLITKRRHQSNTPILSRFFIKQDITSPQVRIWAQKPNRSTGSACILV